MLICIARSVEGSQSSWSTKGSGIAGIARWDGGSRVEQCRRVNERFQLLGFDPRYAGSNPAPSARDFRKQPLNRVPVPDEDRCDLGAASRLRVVARPRPHQDGRAEGAGLHPGVWGQSPLVSCEGCIWIVQNVVRGRKSSRLA